MAFVNARIHWLLHAVLAAVLLLLPVAPEAADKGLTPRLENRITDSANVLSAGDRDRLNGILARYEKETFHQVGVLIVPTLSGETIESFALRVANQFGLGLKGFDNGILIVLAMKEKSVRIELGLGMERYITNDAAQAIIKGTMVPAFARGDFAGGLSAGLDVLMREARRFVIRPEDVAAQKRK